MSNGEAEEEDEVAFMRLTQLADSGTRRTMFPGVVRPSPEILHRTSHE